jgi:hypothetical protein
MITVHTSDRKVHTFADMAQVAAFERKPSPGGPRAPSRTVSPAMVDAVLTWLASQGVPRTRVQLGEGLSVSKSSAIAALATLADAGLVEKARTADSAGRRSATWQLTDDGIAAAAALVA